MSDLSSATPPVFQIGETSTDPVHGVQHTVTEMHLDPASPTLIFFTWRMLWDEALLEYLDVSGQYLVAYAQAYPPDPPSPAWSYGLTYFSTHLRSNPYDVGDVFWPFDPTKRASIRLSSVEHYSEDWSINSPAPFAEHVIYEPPPAYPTSNQVRETRVAFQ